MMSKIWSYKSYKFPLMIFFKSTSLWIMTKVPSCSSNPYLDKASTSMFNSLKIWRALIWPKYCNIYWICSDNANREKKVIYTFPWMKLITREDSPKIFKEFTSLVGKTKPTTPPCYLFLLHHFLWKNMKQNLKGVG